MEAAKNDWRRLAGELPERTRVLCEFAEKLTRTPAAMGPHDLENLRSVGLDDGEILEVVHVVGYFNHINRVADALGVDLEDWMPPKEEK